MPYLGLCTPPPPTSHVRSASVSGEGHLKTTSRQRIYRVGENEAFPCHDLDHR